MPFITPQPFPEFKEKTTFTDLRQGFKNIGMRIVKRAIQSHNFVHGSAGWRFKEDGTIECQKLIAGEYITTFIATSAPTAKSTGDLWFDSDDGYKEYRWSGSAWVDIRDTGIATAIANAATAQATADGKITTFIQASAPTAEGTGDLWLDSDDGYKSYRWSGSAWTDIQDTDIASALTNAATAQAEADRKIVTFYQASAPTAEQTGDFWVDTDDGNKSYRWSGSAWQSSQDLASNWSQVVDDDSNKPDNNADVTSAHDCQHPGDYTASTPQSVSWLTAGTITSKIITLALSAGQGDVYIGGGNNVNAANWRADGGFLLGIDDSDSDKAKFFIGDYANNKYLQYYQGGNLILKGGTVEAATITGSTLQTGTSGANVNIESSRLAVRDSSTEVLILEKGGYGGYLGMNELDGTASLSINVANANGDINFWVQQANAQLTIQASDIYLALDAGGWIAPSTTNSVFCGTTSHAWEVVTAYGFADLCSMYDEIDDIQIIKDIKKKTGANSKDKYGFPIMNLNSLPPFLQHHDETSKKTFRNLGRMVDLCLGAIKQLDDKIEKLEAKIK